MANKKTSMSFLAHVGELRGHLTRSILAIIITSLVATFYWEELVQFIIMAPLKSTFPLFRLFNSFGEWIGYGKVYKNAFDISKNLTNLNPAGQVTSQFYAIIIAGIILAMPYIIYELWKFISPGLKESEKKYARLTVLSIIILFMIGILFSYFMILPLCTRFLFTYDPFGIGNTWTLPSYISLFVQLLLSMGIMFLMPIFVYFLTSVGILNPKFLKDYRKHAFIVVLVIAGTITPNDIYSMLLVTIPLWLLYEFSVIVSIFVYKRQLKRKSKEVVKSK